MKCKLKSLLSDLYPASFFLKRECRGEVTRKFYAEYPIYIRNYSQGDKWISGTVTTAKGPVTYEVAAIEGQGQSLTYRPAEM